MGLGESASGEKTDMIEKLLAKPLLPGLSALAILLVAALAIAESHRRRAINLFEQVWEVVDNTYYDRNFNGYDWKSVHDTFLAKLSAQGANESNAASVIDEMLGLLESSHLAF